MKRFAFIALCATAMLFACNNAVTKKVLIMGRGDITATGNDIAMKDGSGYAEQTVEVTGDKAVSWNVETPAGKTTITIPEDKGFYILNLKTDTIVGAEQIMGRDLGTRTISQEELKVKIDSLTKLTAGANVSSHNYFILPKQLIKISPNIEAKVFGPFNKIPSTLEADKNGNAPELYKFYTNTEMRELIANLKKQSY